MSAVTFTYGSWTPAIAPKLVISRTPVKESVILVSGLATPTQYDELWIAEGQFVGADGDPQGSLLSQLAAAEAALSVNHGTIALSRTEGHIRRYTAADTIDGIIVDAVSLPNIDGAELATVLTWSAAFRFRVNASGQTSGTQYTIEVESDDNHTTIGVKGSIAAASDVLAETYASFKASLKTSIESAQGVAIRLMGERTLTYSDQNLLTFSLQYDSKTPKVYGWRQHIEIQPSVYLGIPIPIVPGVQTNPVLDVPVMQIGGRTPAIGRDSGVCMGTTGYPQFPASVFSVASNPYAAPPVMNKLAPKVGSNQEILGYPIEWSYTHYVSHLLLVPPDPYSFHPTGLLSAELTP